MKKTTGKTPPTSAGRKKLATLGIQLPLIPATTAGSLPKNSELIELRYKVAQNVVQPLELERKERIAIENWLREQTRIGVDVLVDGEMERGDFISHFSGRIEGFNPGGRVRIYGNRYYRKPIIREKLSWKRPLISDSWQVSLRATHAPLKAIITGPGTLMDFSFNEFYSSREEIVRDLIPILKKEITALTEAGAKIIQIDEPALTSHPHEFPMIADALKELIKGQRPYFILHHSYGEVNGLWPKIEKLPFDNFSFAAANSGMDILKIIKQHPTDKDVTIGVIDSSVPEVESPKILDERIKSSLKVIPKTQLWLSTDSGLKTLAAETAIDKMNALVKGTAKGRK